MSPEAALPALVAAWSEWDQRPSGETSSNAFHEAVESFAAAYNMSPLFLRSEMARMRRQRPQPEYAAVLMAVVAERGDLDRGAS